VTFEGLRDEVAAANRAIDAAGLVTLAFGNASGVDREAGVLLIKPSGVRCADVRPASAASSTPTRRPPRRGPRPPGRSPRSARPTPTISAAPSS
jgi:class II aldolase/adducin N-terminal domain-containing protein